MEIDPKGGMGPQTLAALRDLGGTYVALVAGFGATD
jgi:tartrate dehydratase beta subunit/fumarate hydratase class I family protein